MKWLRYFMVRLTFLAYFFSHVNTATRDGLETVFLRLYNGKTNESYIDAKLHEAENLVSHFDTEKPMVVYVHGFTESINSSSVHAIVNAYLNRSDHNVLAADWSVLAGENYIAVVQNVEPVGTSLAKVLNDFVSAGFPSQNIHVVGHSMGSHVSAYMGRNVDFPLQRITGLDPAGPFFNLMGNPLTSSDAEFVDIVHTDMGVYGIIRITGTVDFFPNSGRRIQPGCPTKFSLYSADDFCSHHRSWVFYAESLIDENAFPAVRCSHSMRIRRRSAGVTMGYGVSKQARGSYCLITSSSAPYGLGEAGNRQPKKKGIASLFSLNGLS